MLKDGTRGTRKQWIAEGEDKSRKLGPMIPALQWLEEMRAADKVAGLGLLPGSEFQLMGDDCGSTDPQYKSTKRYGVATLDIFYLHLCQEKNARNRCMYSTVLESNGPVILMMDVDAKCQDGGRVEFIAMLKAIMGEIMRMAREESGEELTLEDFIVDDTFETHEVNGEARCSAHILCRRIAFNQITDALVFNQRLKLVFPGIDGGIPKRRGLFKWPGNCKKKNGARWQFPNPTLALEAPAHYAREMRDSIPYAQVVSWEEFLRRRPWLSPAEIGQVAWWPVILPPLSRSSPSSSWSSCTEDAEDGERASSRPAPRMLSNATLTPYAQISADEQSQLQVCFDEILTSLRAMPRWRSETSGTSFYGQMRCSEKAASLCLRGWGRCSPEIKHKSNNLTITLFYDTRQYWIRCMDDACQHHKTAHYDPPFRGTL